MIISLAGVCKKFRLFDACSTANHKSPACAMASIGILVSFPDAAIAPPSLVPLGTAAFAIPLCFNFIVTGLIVGRLWYKGRQVQFALRSSRVPLPSKELLHRAMIVCIESG